MITKALKLGRGFLSNKNISAFI